MKITVVLNGGPDNFYRHYGLTCNPFPAIPDARFETANRMLRELDSDPLAGVEDIRKILAGCDQEFIDLCCARFVPGQRVRFTVEWPDGAR